MTTIICERYGTSLAGVRKYAANRLLRIYPTYLVVFTFTILALTIIGSDAARAVDPNLSIPETVKSWLMNTTLIGLDFSIQDRTIPPSWTLFVELFFYAVIPLLVRLGAKSIIIWVIMSIAYHAYFMLTATDAGLDWNSRYGDILAGSLGFALGCAARFFPYKVLRFNGAIAISVLGLTTCYSITAYFMLIGYNNSDWRYISTFGFYFTMAFSILFIVNSINIPQSKFGKFLGDLSYPLYLSHIPIGFVVISAFEMQPRTPLTFVVCFSFSIIGSIALYIFDKRVNKIRDRIRPRSTKSPA
nr:acyltransferase [Serratia sp. JSRIV002]